MFQSHFIKETKQNKEQLLSLFCATLFSAIICYFYSISTSPLYEYEGTDSCVFKTMGLALLEGKIPYRDYFDHKGPILYFINALGLSFGRYGVFHLQIIFNTISFYYFSKIARLFVGRLQSFLILIIIFLIYGCFFTDGNQCEEWILPAIVASYYYTLRFFLHESINPPKKYFIFLGICLSYTFFLRANDSISHIGGLLFGVFAYMLCGRHYRIILSRISYVIIGFSLLTVPILCYFTLHDSLNELFYGMIKFNALYSGGFFLQLKSVFFLEKSTILVLLFTVLIVNCLYKKELLFAVLPPALLSFVFLGTRGYFHYYIPMLPLFLLLFSITFKLKRSTILLVSCLLWSVCHSQYLNLFERIPGSIINCLNNRSANKDICCFYTETTKMFNHVPISERTKIWNYNLKWPSTLHPNANYYSSFYRNDIIPCNKVSLYTMLRYDSNLAKANSVVDHRPIWIVLTHDYDSESIDDFKDYDFIFHNYKLVAKTNDQICNIELYRRL